MTSFYVIAHEHRILVERIKEDFGDDEQTMLDTIESISFPLEEKATAVAYAIKELELLAGAAAIAEKEAAGSANPYYQGGRPPLVWYFCVRCMASLRFWRAVRGTFGCAGSLIPVLLPARLCLPDSKRECGKLNRNQGVNHVRILRA
jgi:hypothetical protein